MNFRGKDIISALKTGRFNAAERDCIKFLRKFPANPAANNLAGVIRQARETISREPYWQEFQGERQIYRDYPRWISIETVGTCNATCAFCPHKELARRTTVMAENLFEKILNDISRIPVGLPIRISPNLINEPFMDRKILQRLDRINSVIPRAAITIFTNLNFLPEGFWENLEAINNIDTFNVSFNAANKDEYEKSMGINFDSTVKNILDLLHWNRKYRKIAGYIILSRVMDGSSNDQRYKEDCAKLFYPFVPEEDYHAVFKARTDWLGAIAGARSPVPYGYPCGGWLDINVMCDGTVPHCCQDVHGKYALGNVTKSSLLDIYNGPFRKLRESATSREDITPCNRCALLQ